MGQLVDDFAGKTAGELIRASDWNGLIAAIEGQLAALETSLNAKIDALTPRVTSLEGRVTALESQMAPLNALAAAIRQRQRRLDLNATRSAFAIGERAEIVAQVTDMLGAPLDLSNAATRPWIDFVTVWGTLKAASGFTSIGGQTSRSVSVQVNAAGEARVLLRADHSDSFAEDQELEVSTLMATDIGGGRTVATAFLGAASPGAATLAPAYSAVSAAYDRVDTHAMRSYLDTYYVRNPSQVFNFSDSLFGLSWRDMHTTVLAFVKPDNQAGSPDGALAVGSIRVTFRDWVNPWIVTQYLPPSPPVISRYKDRFPIEIGPRYEDALQGVFEVIRDGAVDRGVLGMQRELAAAQEALATINVANPPSYLQDLVNTVSGGLTVQQGMLFSQSVTPMFKSDIASANAVGFAGAQGQIAVGKAADSIRADTDKRFSEAEGRIMAGVQAENAKFSNDLLSADGPVRRAENLAVAASLEARGASSQLNQKAGIDMVSKLLSAVGAKG
ncbi:MAG: hypothetical protein AB7O80_05505 [Acetobacteraceae bacterium]